MTTATLGSALRTGFQRWQFWLLLLIIGILSVALLQAMREQDMDRYGLENTSLDGYAALAQVLEDHEVTLHPAASSEIAAEMMDDLPDAPLVVLSTGEVPDEAFLDELRRGSSRDVLLISETTELPSVLFPDGEVTFAGTQAGGGPAASATVELGEQCAVPAAQNAGSIEATGTLFHSDYPGCFTGFEDSQGPAQLLLDTPNGILFGAPDAFSNSEITQAGNAALALWLFGQHEDLIWYTPMGLDTLASDDWASPTDFLPGWVLPLAWWLLLCALVLMFVNGRRAGPIVSEPLPVQVPSAETAEGRGRMYQRANAVNASAQTLRSAHLIRIARLLRLGAGANQSSITAAAARHLRRDPAELAGLLAQEPKNNAELVAYAQALATLEDQARQAVLTQHTRTQQSPSQQGKNTSND